MKHVKVRKIPGYYLVVHFQGVDAREQTLCGDFGFGVETAERVNCLKCITIIKIAKNVKRSEYES